VPRRTTKNISGIKGAGKVDYSSVWRVVECSNPECQRLFKVREDDHSDHAPVVCPECEYENGTELFERAGRQKYCRVCEILQPLENFHKHKPNEGSFRSGRQLECRVCKNTKINPTLNPLRTSDQHRESSDRRRLYMTLSQDAKINAEQVYEAFNGECFNCGARLKRITGGSGFHLDHTLPAKYLWPLSLGPTLLCVECNNSKHDVWPSKFYNQTKLRQLAIKTGIRYELLAGEPRFNPDAIARIQGDIDDFLARWVKYADEIGKLRNLILSIDGVDIFEGAQNVPDYFYV
jgi:hypothetical protein